MISIDRGEPGVRMKRGRNDFDVDLYPKAWKYACTDRLGRGHEAPAEKV